MERELPINATKVVSAGIYEFVCPTCSFTWTGDIYAASQCPSCNTAKPTINLPINCSMDEMKSQIYAAVVLHFQGNITHSSRSLGISVRTLQRHFNTQGKFK